MGGEVLAKLAPVPLAVPSRLATVEAEEKKGNWQTAGDYREVAARVFLLVTAPFFERESDRAKDGERQARLRAESPKYLKLARESFARAAENYARAAEEHARRTDAQSARLAARCRRKAAEMETEAGQVALLVEARGPAR